MAKRVHEIRDPIHTFVRLDSEERRILDSRPLRWLSDERDRIIQTPPREHDDGPPEA